MNHSTHLKLVNCYFNNPTFKSTLKIDVDMDLFSGIIEASLLGAIMQLKEVQIGMQVKVSKASDTVYKVVELNGFGVRLEYKLEDGTIVDGGWIDVCYLIKQ